VTPVKTITVVIPFSDVTKIEINRLVHALCCQEVLPTEVIFVGSPPLLDSTSKLNAVHEKATEIAFKQHEISGAFPGRARNIGVAMATGFYIGFLDIQTLPEPSWLRSIVEVLEEDECDGIVGSCYFVGNSFFSWILIDALFGRGPVRAFPSSLFKASALLKIGPMLERVRSGEDNEWLQRAILMNTKLKSYATGGLCKYFGLADFTYLRFCTKWIRNYRDSAQLIQYTAVYQVNVACWSLLFCGIALNWNSFLAGWNTSHPLYLPHVTKFVILGICVFYVMLRAIYLPVKRGSSWQNILSYRFPLILLVVVTADLIKSILFLFRFLLPGRSTSDRIL
jgi:hypothetical protein